MTNEPEDELVDDFPCLEIFPDRTYHQFVHLKVKQVLNLLNYQKKVELYLNVFRRREDVMNSIRHAFCFYYRH